MSSRRERNAERALTLLLSILAILCAAVQLLLFGGLTWIGHDHIRQEQGGLILCFGSLLCLGAGFWCARNVFRQRPSGSGRTATGTLLLLASLLISPFLIAVTFFPTSSTLGGLLGMPRRIHPYPTGLAAVEGTAVWLSQLLLPLVAGCIGLYLLSTERRH